MHPKSQKKNIVCICMWLLVIQTHISHSVAQVGINTNGHGVLYEVITFTDNGTDRTQEFLWRSSANQMRSSSLDKPEGIKLPVQTIDIEIVFATSPKHQYEAQICISHVVDNKANCEAMLAFSILLFGFCRFCADLFGLERKCPRTFKQWLCMLCFLWLDTTLTAPLTLQLQTQPDLWLSHPSEKK